MDYTNEDYARLYGDRGPQPLKRAVRYWSSVALMVLAIYGATFLVLSIERTVAPEPKKADPIAEKLVFPRSFVIDCDATITSRGAQEKWTPPECYRRAVQPATTAKVSR